MTIARRLKITGRVQGVFYRSWTREQARELGLAGWVRNCPDGSVEAFVEGDEPIVQQLIVRLRQGPPAARVDEVSSEEADVQNATDFEVRR